MVSVEGGKDTGAASFTWTRFSTASPATKPYPDPKVNALHRQAERLPKCDERSLDGLPVR
jgi:hypothetical protein